MVYQDQAEKRFVLRFQLVVNGELVAYGEEPVAFDEEPVAYSEELVAYG